MSISKKDSKRLWAKSGNRCAICKEELVKTNKKGLDYIIGEECHIISSKSNGPRYENGLKNYDCYENLILLCRNHHKEIDEVCNVGKYSKNELIRIKKEHELLMSQYYPLNYPLRLMLSGRELYNVVTGVYEVRWNEIMSSEGDSSVVSMIQHLVMEKINDYALLGESERIDFVNELHELLNDFSKKGIFIYGRKYIMPVKFYNGAVEKLPIAVLSIIIKMNEEK